MARLAGAAVMAFAVLTLAAAASRSAPAVATERPNLLLVTIDTLRADRVGVYGYATARTPNLDGLAKAGVLLEEAVVQVPQTRPSHASLFTGRHPFEHGLRDNDSPALDARLPTLATTLKGHGYATGAFIGAYPVSRASGLQRGFDTFDDPFSGGSRAGEALARTERRAAEVVDRALLWLRQPRAAPFYAWVHLFDPHAPYEPPARFARLFSTRPYDGEVAYADDQLGRLLRWLEEARVRQRTLVVVTSDHGEGLGDHGQSEHLFFVYDSTLRVPLVLAWPGRLAPGRRVQGQFRSVDLLPTLLDLLALPAVPVSGVSRAEQVRSGAVIPDNESYAESLYGALHYGWAPLRALRAEGWKYIDAPRPELYRLREDAGERRNLLDLRAPVAAAMRSRLAAHDKGPAPAATRTMDPEAAERLAALGYVAGGPAVAGASGADPKDRVPEAEAYQRDMRSALRLYRERKLPAATRLLQRLSRSRLTSFNVEYYLGRSLLDQGRAAEAVASLQKAVAMAPTAVPAYLALAQAQAAAGRIEEALRAVETALARAPDDPDLHRARGSLLLRRDDLTGAREALEKARTLDPRDAVTRVELSAAYRRLQDFARAQAEAEEAVRLDRKSPQARLALGLALGAAGREQDAGAAFREAVRLAPAHPDALFYLAAVELRAGRGGEAAVLLEKLLSIAPQYPGAADALAAARAAAPAAGPAPAAGAIHLRLLRVPDRAQASELARRAAAGEDFAALARAHSQDASAARGGDLGTVGLTDLAEPLRSAAAALAVGTVSPPIETPAGFVVLKRER